MKKMIIFLLVLLIFSFMSHGDIQKKKFRENIIVSCADNVVVNLSENIKDNMDDGSYFVNKEKVDFQDLDDKEKKKRVNNGLFYSCESIKEYCLNNSNVSGCLEYC